MSRFFPPQRNFSSLSVKDLLEAREAYHVHLAHLENVVATAIGRYRIRKQDPDTEKPDQWRPRTNAPRRTLANTVVRKWSWPCLLVFVDKWLTEEDLRREPDQVVPRVLYLPDGRVVPTCVILAERQPATAPPLLNLTFPADLAGGGYPIFTEVQGQQHLGSLGCLVTDGDTVFALTNRHVTGQVRFEQSAREVLTMVRGQRQRIGISHGLQIGKKPFQDTYPGWPVSRALCNLDAGLIRIDDVSSWTAQVFGIGELDDPVDLNTDTISMDLIGCPVRAFGGASGELRGEIHGLFYRYKSIGGFDYVSDLLIGPRDENSPLDTLPGDSGTVWFFDPPESSKAAKVNGGAGRRARQFRPIALQWGGHNFVDAGGKQAMRFALATCLSTICRELDLDIVRDWNIGHSEYWGKLGHYKIGAKACELLSSAKLKKLLLGNQNAIAFDDQAIAGGQLKKIDPAGFVPLADVPDLVWRASRRKDEGNHFADMDEPGKGEFENRTLLDLCRNQANVEIELWNRFYDSLSIGFKRGALPFRVWQIYNDMVRFVSEGKVPEFVCAAGVLAHYVGDTCQPLHISRLHHGRPGHPEEVNVHSVYETTMLDRFAIDLVAGVNQKLGGKKARPRVKGGKASAVAVIKLMKNTVRKLPPIDVITAFNGASGRDRVPHMWAVLGGRTTSCLAEGCLALATLWESAWKEGRGNRIKNSQLGTVDRATLKKLYNTNAFLEAFRLEDPKFATALA
jgi:hypothetical protein